MPDWMRQVTKQLSRDERTRPKLGRPRGPRNAVAGSQEEKGMSPLALRFGRGNSGTCTVVRGMARVDTTTKHEKRMDHRTSDDENASLCQSTHVASLLFDGLGRSTAFHSRCVPSDS